MSQLPVFEPLLPDLVGFGWREQHDLMKDYEPLILSPDYPELGHTYIL